eukprot:UN24474
MRNFGSRMLLEPTCVLTGTWKKVFVLINKKKKMLCCESSKENDLAKNEQRVTAQSFNF